MESSMPKKAKKGGPSKHSGTKLYDHRVNGEPVKSTKKKGKK